MIKLRVKAYSRLEPEARGYVGRTRVHYQDLQRKRWWGWQTIDREEVPGHVRLSLAVFGDSGGWVSKFAKLGKFGKDGIIVTHGDETITLKIVQDIVQER